jgi:xanthine dehydrogenase accessory factor
VSATDTPGGQLYPELRDAITAQQPIALATIIRAGNPDVVGLKLMLRPGTAAAGTLGGPELDRIVARDGLAELEVGRTGVRHYGPEGQGNYDAEAADCVHVFVESFAPPPQMIIFGAVDFTAALAKVAKVLGYRVTVCDARRTFATTKRFPMADEVIVQWPGDLLDRIGSGLTGRDAVCILTHDPKFDVPAIAGALATKVGYIGVMGSRKTHERRTIRLVEEGITQPGQVARIMAPIGLDIGARSPEETAISICAEIIARRTGRAAPSLREGAGPIHHA